MKKFKASPFVLAIGLLGLGACAGPSVHFTDFYTVYDGSEVLYAGRNGALRIEAFGRLTLEEDLDAEALAQAVAQIMARHGPGWFQVDYVTEAREDVDSYYRLRWMFNVPAGFPIASACSNQASTARPMPKRTRKVRSFLTPPSDRSGPASAPKAPSRAGSPRPRRRARW